MQNRVLLAIAAVCGPLFAPLHAAAQPAADPTWPCIQRKVENLSLGLMWPHPVTESMPTPEERELIETLTLRRITLEEAETLVADYVATHPGIDEADLGRIFEGVFNRVNRQRRALVSGIGRYAVSQQALSEKIDATRTAFDAAEQADPPDYDRLDALEAEMDWDTRIFEDRAHSLTYVCETPVLLEQRLYAIAKILLAQAPSR